MKKVLFLFLFPNYSYSQKLLEFYDASKNKLEYYIKYDDNKKAYYFNRPSETFSFLRILEDSVTVKITDSVTNYKYGPYRFKKNKKAIKVGIKRSFGWKYYFLYNLDTFFRKSPILFTDDLTSDYGRSKLLERNVDLEVNGNELKCYKILYKAFTFHQKEFYKILYIDMHSLLPIKEEFYDDISLLNKIKTLLSK